MGLALGVVTGTILSFEFGLLWPGFMAAFGNVFGLGFMLEGFSFVAAVGIILRGASYALRGQLDGAPRRRLIEDVFALSSVLTPFALGTFVGAIASGRVPVGNAQGDLFASWLNPTSVLTGALAVGTSSYLAAVYLAADARRVGDRTLVLDFRARALWTGVIAGALAIGGLAVVRFDAEPIWHGLTSGPGLAMGQRLRRRRARDAHARLAQPVRSRARVGRAGGRGDRGGLGVRAARHSSPS